MPGHAEYRMFRTFHCDAWLTGCGVGVEVVFLGCGCADSLASLSVPVSPLRGAEDILICEKYRWVGEVEEETDPYLTEAWV